MLLELFPIVLAVEIWGDSFRNFKVLFNCDNLGVVQVVNRLSADSQPVVQLLRHLVLHGLQLNTLIYAVYLPGEENTSADALSY